MDKFIVHGPCKLSGQVEISTAKNSILPIMAATILSDVPVILSHVPKLRDVESFIHLLQHLGHSVDVDELEKKSILRVNPSPNASCETPYDIVRKMRASVLILGPLLARYGKASVSMPGGCAIGERPIDIHIEGLRALGAKIELNEGQVKASAPEGLKGSVVDLKFPSVTATENLMMAATLAKGATVLRNVAREPEIVDLANFLRTLGAKISGDGGEDIRIEGVKALRAPSESYRAISDRIEALTFLIAGILTNSHLQIHNVNPSHIANALKILRAMGANLEVSEEKNTIEVFPWKKLKSIQVDTAPFPGYPTDAQAQLMVLCLVAKGKSVISENIFENRFMHVAELRRMSADIALKGKLAEIHGRGEKDSIDAPVLTGAPVMCTDLRASAALILAALVAKGKTEISRVYHVDRGYDGIDEKLRRLGASIERV